MGLQHDMWMFDMTTSTSVQEPSVATSSSFTLYPNPVADGQVRMLCLQDGFDRATAELFDADGRRVQVLESGATTLQLPRDLAPGQYYVTFTAPGVTMTTRKITVMR